jgi:hypothetical protein
MARHWPPSPSVEDEESALAREHALAQPLESKSEDTPAGTRGTVDQYPIILDVDSKASISSDDTSSDNERHSAGHSSDESLGPPTPTHSKSEQRFVYIPKVESKTAASAQTSAAATSQPGKKEVPRGRPNVSRIQTDLGGDLQEMITGRRRAPSPYVYTPANKPEMTEHGNRFSGEFLLSPEHAKLPTIDHKRESSARPRVRTEDLDSSTDSDRRPERRRHHSRKRSTRESFARAQPSLSEPTVRPLKHDAHAASGPDANPGPGLLSQGLQKEARDVRDAEQTAHTLKKPARESPYTSSAEESRTRTNRQHVSRTENKSSWDSPHTSSAKESNSKRHNPESGTIRPRRGSMRRRPHLDLQSHHYSYGEGDIPDEKQESRKHRKDPKHHSVYDGRSYLEPSSLRSPKAAEDYFEKAFQDNVARRTGISPRPSPAASPTASPPETPPRTPRPDRRPKDYFSLGASLPGQSPVQPRPRPSSKEETFFKDLNPLAAAIATAAIGKLATEIPASLSRTSTSAAEKTSAGPTSRTSSGRRSRNSSPTREDPKPTSRTNSFAQSDMRPAVARPPTFPVNDVRPLSRTASYALPQDQSPRHPQRTFSYSSADEHPYQRPGHTPRTSQTNFLPVTVTETNVASAGPRPIRSSPSSSEKVPLLPAVNIVPKSLPSCPRSNPVAGYQDWYTIKEMPEIDICPTCMTSIGNSRFRDSFIPSLAKPRTQEIQCALSKPWIRNAWIQIMKQRRHSLDLIYQLIHLPPTTMPCPGKKGEVRLWYRIVDPETGSPVPNFEACSACVRGVEYMFPPLQGVFKRSAGLVERTCDLTCESKRFVGYMAQFDLAATRCDAERLREPNIQALADHARRTARVRECTRDDKIRSQPWHFIPQLPEFTICEECFQDVVWPVINKPIAGKINRTLQMLPGEEQHTNGVSCQLYSDRMRKTFWEAVQYNDFDLLKSVATRRFGIEKLLQEKHRLLVRDMKMGIDRTTELQETIRTWMQFE